VYGHTLQDHTQAILRKFVNIQVLYVPVRFCDFLPKYRQKTLKKLQIIVSEEKNYPQEYFS